MAGYQEEEAGSFREMSSARPPADCDYVRRRLHEVLAVSLDAGAGRPAAPPKAELQTFEAVPYHEVLKDARAIGWRLDGAIHIGVAPRQSARLQNKNAGPMLTDMKPNRKGAAPKVRRDGLAARAAAAAAAAAEEQEAAAAAAEEKEAAAAAAEEEAAAAAAGAEVFTMESARQGVPERAVADALAAALPVQSGLDGDSQSLSVSDLASAIGSTGLGEMMAMLPVLSEGMPTPTTQQNDVEKLLQAFQPGLAEPRPVEEAAKTSEFSNACQSLGLVNLSVPQSQPVAANEVLEGVASPVAMLIHSARGNRSTIATALARLPPSANHIRDAVETASVKRSHFEQRLQQVNELAGQTGYNFDKYCDRMLTRVKSHVLNGIVITKNRAVDTAAARSVQGLWLRLANAGMVYDEGKGSGPGGGDMNERIDCMLATPGGSIQITKATGFAYKGMRERMWCTHDDRHFICDLTRESLAQNLRLSAEMMKRDASKSITQLLGVVDGSGNSMIEIVATLMTHDRLPSLGKKGETSFCDVPQPLARRYARAAATGLLHADNYMEEEGKDKSKTRTSNFERDVVKFLKKPVPARPVNPEAANPARSQIAYVDYLCEYAEMVARASAYGGGWYGQSLLAQEVAHRLILRRSALKKDDASTEYADLLYSRTPAGNEAMETVLLGSGGLNDRDVLTTPGGLGINARAAVSNVAAQQQMDIYVYEDVIRPYFLDLGLWVKATALGLGKSMLQTLKKIFEERPMAWMRAVGYYGVIDYFLPGFLGNFIRNTMWAMTPSTMMGELVYGTLSYVQRIVDLASGLSFRDWYLYPMLVGGGAPPALAYALSQIFLFSWRTGSLFLLYRSARRLRVGWRRPTRALPAPQVAPAPPAPQVQPEILIRISQGVPAVQVARASNNSEASSSADADA